VRLRQALGDDVDLPPVEGGDGASAKPVGNRERAGSI
jgi:hypothetical protein